MGLITVRDTAHVFSTVATVAALAQEMTVICWHMLYIAISGKDLSTYALSSFVYGK